MLRCSLLRYRSLVKHSARPFVEYFDDLVKDSKIFSYFNDKLDKKYETPWEQAATKYIRDIREGIPREGGIASKFMRERKGQQCTAMVLEETRSGTPGEDTKWPTERTEIIKGAIWRITSDVKENAEGSHSYRLLHACGTASARLT